MNNENLLFPAACFIDERFLSLINMIVNGKPEALREEILSDRSIINKRGGHDSDGEHTLLTFAIYAGRHEIVKMLLALGADPNCRGYRQHLPLPIAIGCGNRISAADLVSAGAEINPPHEYTNPLVFAAAKNDIESIEWLHSLGAIVGDGSSETNNALLAAALSGHPEAVSKFISLGADVNRVWTSDLHNLGNTPHLLYAVVSGHNPSGNYLATHDVLLKAGAAVPAELEVIKPLLNCAIQQHSIVAYQILRRNPELIHQLSSDGKSALHIACRYKNFKLAETLLNSGANINTPDSDGMTPIAHVLTGDGDVQMLKLLLKRGAELKKLTRTRTRVDTIFDPSVALKRHKNTWRGENVCEEIRQLLIEHLSEENLSKKCLKKFTELLEAGHRKFFFVHDSAMPHNAIVATHAALSTHMKSVSLTPDFNLCEILKGPPPELIIISGLERADGQWVDALLEMIVSWESQSAEPILILSAGCDLSGWDRDNPEKALIASKIRPELFSRVEVLTVTEH